MPPPDVISKQQCHYWRRRRRVVLPKIARLKLSHGSLEARGEIESQSCTWEIGGQMPNFALSLFSRNSQQYPLTSSSAFWRKSRVRSSRNPRSFLVLLLSLFSSRLRHQKSLFCAINTAYYDVEEKFDLYVRSFSRKFYCVICVTNAGVEGSIASRLYHLHEFSIHYKWLQPTSDSKWNVDRR